MRSVATKKAIKGQSSVWSVCWGVWIVGNKKDGGTDWEVKDEDNWVLSSVPYIALETFTWLETRWVVVFLLPPHHQFAPF